MNPVGHYHTMTDAQLAEWHQLTTRADQLTRDLAEAQKSAAVAAATADAENLNLSRELIARGDAIINLTMKLNDRTSQLRRNAAAIVQCLSALKGLLEAVHLPAVLAHQHGWPGEVYRAVQDAEEVVKLLDIPF